MHGFGSLANGVSVSLVHRRDPGSRKVRPSNPGPSRVRLTRLTAHESHEKPCKKDVRLRCFDAQSAWASRDPTLQLYSFPNMCHTDQQVWTPCDRSVMAS